jgi:hypothetical protein
MAPKVAGSSTKGESRLARSWGGEVGTLLVPQCQSVPQDRFVSEVTTYEPQEPRRVARH